MKKSPSQYSLFISCVSALFLSACSTISPSTSNWEKNKIYNLTILHTNDHHGRFWTNKHGEYGMAARKTLIDRLRKQVEERNGSVLLLSGGDINTGVPESDLQDAEPDFKGMSKIGYDAMALGNHEFDNSLTVLKKQKKWANFPMLSANIYDRKTNKRLFKPYQIFNKQGIKIAIIGLTTEDTKKIGNPEFIGGLDFKDPKTEAQKIINELKQSEKPDLIFAVTHMGHYQDGSHGINAPGDVSLAKSLNQGDLHMIIGGHSQEPVCMEPNNKKYDKAFKSGNACLPDQQNGTWIAQAHEWGKYVGKADFTFKNGKLTLTSYELIPVNLKKKIKVNGKKKRVFIQNEIKEDEELKAFLQPYQDKGQKELNVVIGRIDNKLEGDRNIVRFKQTNLGYLIATAQKQRAKADFGIMNSGGVRDSIEAGDVTYKDVLKVQPFANNITYVDMTGKEIIGYLDVVATKPVDTGAYPQFSGITMTIYKNKVANVKINGKAINENKNYRFTVPSFNASGGDGYPKLISHKGYVNSGFVDAEVLKEFIESKSPLKTEHFKPNKGIIFKN